MSNRARIREEARKLNPIDDLMFRKMAEDLQFCQEILRVILSDKSLTVLETVVQYTGTNLKGRSVILDAKCVLGDKTQVNIEVQKADDDNHQKRVRYNGAILTTNIAEPGDKFDQIPNVCIVFISKFDVFKRNYAIYHIERVIRETGEVADNGFQEVYVNAKAKFPITSESKRRYKETEEGQQIMCDIMERIAKEERKQGRKEGRKEINKLNAILIERNRFDDLKRAAIDYDYQVQLMMELLPNEKLGV